MIMDIPQFCSPMLEKRLLTPDTASFIFVIPEGVVFNFLPGDAIQIVTEKEGKPVKRFYTPIPVLGRKDVFELIIKRYDQGMMSCHIHDELALHDCVRFRGPIVRPHYVPGSASKINMVAGGTGLTPMIGILRKSFELKEPVTLNFIFANKHESDIISREELDKLAAEHENLNLTYVLESPPEGWTGETGFVTIDVMKQHLSEKGEDTLFYFCGPPPMLRAIKGVVGELGFEPEDILLP
jgi:cytochrome-b5 reductase